MIIADLFQVLRRLICGLFEITDNEYLFQLGLSLSIHFVFNIFTSSNVVVPCPGNPFSLVG